ncbi:hypothetical protein [Legionella erythra]|uniref:Uncharacterized protein n=2 Tax=Legionella erythra TaxID=448 RepID=A0A0W0TFF6_LEGER|nr:hypothetical protein [Legionella erythra]KTC94306.1 hypothetical protein Lery_2473 [Legionella erythra]
MKKTLNDKGFKGLLFTNTQKEGKKEELKFGQNRLDGAPEGLAPSFEEYSITSQKASEMAAKDARKLSHTQSYTSNRLKELYKTNNVPSEICEQSESPSQQTQRDVVDRSAVLIPSNYGPARISILPPKSSSQLAPGDAYDKTAVSMPNHIPRKISDAPSSFSRFTRTNTVDNAVTPYDVEAISRKNSQMDMLIVNPSEPSHVLSRQVSVDEVVCKASADSIPPSRKPPAEPGKVGLDEVGTGSELEPHDNGLLQDMERLDPTRLSNSIKSEEDKATDDVKSGKEEVVLLKASVTLPHVQDAASESIIQILSEPNNEFKNNSLLNGYTCWYDNMDFIRDNVTLYKQKSKLESIRELQKLLGYLLNDRRFESLKGIEKTAVNYEEGKSRLLNWVLLLIEISTVIHLFNTKTRENFDKPLGGELALVSMNAWLPTRQMAKVASSVTSKEIQDRLLLFFALFADKASKESPEEHDIRALFIKQVLQDFKKIEDELVQSHLNLDQFEHIKYLTLDSFIENSSNRHLFAPHGYFNEFADLLTWLRNLKLPRLESVIIDGFVDNPFKSNFVSLVSFLEKNSNSLKKVVLGKCFSEEEREILKHKLPTLKIALQSEETPKKTLGFFKKEPKPTLSPATTAMKFT